VSVGFAGLRRATSNPLALMFACKTSSIPRPISMGKIEGEHRVAPTSDSGKTPNYSKLVCRGVRSGALLRVIIT
jgi:hypothetical protein